MKLIQVKIVLRNRADYENLIRELNNVFMSHTAVYDSPKSYTVFVKHAHIGAEAQLDRIIDMMRLSDVNKTPLTEVTQPGVIPQHLSRVAA